MSYAVDHSKQDDIDGLRDNIKLLRPSACYLYGKIFTLTNTTSCTHSAVVCFVWI
jgi:hypothetical protein